MYLRVSLDATGEQLAVSRQREDCLGIIRHKGWGLAQEYVDNSISASDAKKARPAYEQMARDYEAGAFDALVCWDLDRLTRQPRQLEDWIDRAEKRGLLLVTANGEADLSTDGGRMFARIKAAVARAEVERKGARQRRALRQRAEMGRPALGTRLTGYFKDGSVNQPEADLVRHIFEWFANGQSLYAIARRVQESGISTRRGDRWHQSTIREMLTNARYAGIQVYRGEEIGDGNWPAIVDKDTFRLVNAKLSDPARKTAFGTARKYLGSGIFRCGTCGLPLRSSSSQRYTCRDRCLSRSMEQVDEHVCALVEGWLSEAATVGSWRPSGTPRTSPLVARQERLIRRLQTTSEDYDQGLIDGARFKAATDRIKDELSTVSRELAKQSGRPALASMMRAPDPAATFRAADLDTRRAVVDALVTVELLPAPRGSRMYNPELVRITWK
ncbi:hypothetical protein AESSP_00377 [Aestuariimicrobium sp. T2.26MG-19.2B]|nr:hypothetical protein AESSP_00377 [Aestuariimicrobium sp. T2.26MG-19.2B]